MDSSRRRVVWLMVVAAASVVVRLVAQQTPVFRTTGDVVPVFVTVTDKSDRIVTTLTRDDFQVFDNGRPQRLTVFDNSPQPIRLIVLLDVSTSMMGNLPILREACEVLFSHLRPDDAARLGTFGDEITISPRFTTDVAELMSAVPRSISPNAPTPLWRAMDQAMSELAGINERRVILVMSDSKDSMAGKFGQKFIGQLDVTERAQREEIMVYGVGLRSRGPMPMGGNPMAAIAGDFPDPGLGTVAVETGGGYFEVRPRDDLGATFARVADELHSQYLLGFAPAVRDGKPHKLEVKMTPRDLKVRARKSYVAPR
jgi:Ca-activated chloride channel homolog